MASIFGGSTVTSLAVSVLANNRLEADGAREVGVGVAAAHARRSLAGALDAQVKTTVVSAFRSQQDRGGCRLNRALDAIRAGGGVVGYKDAAPLSSEGAVKFGV